MTKQSAHISSNEYKERIIVKNLFSLDILQCSRATVKTNLLLL